MKKHRFILGWALAGVVAIGGCRVEGADGGGAGGDWFVGGAGGLGGTGGQRADATSDREVAEVTRVELRDELRGLWTEHAAWTRLFLVSAIAGLPDVEVAGRRALRNQDDLANVMRPFYGDAAADDFAALLRGHVLGAGAVAAAAQAGETDRFLEAKAGWYANATEIAGTLAALNPSWSRFGIESALHTQLDRTLLEVGARLDGDWALDVAAFDAIEADALAMADLLTDGIATQFPDRVGNGTAEADDATDDDADALRVELRRLWGQHVFWTRMMVVTDLAGLPDAAATAGRLVRNQLEIGDALRPYYGDAIADELVQRLGEHVGETATMLAAVRLGDAEELRAVTAAWYANADAIAAVVAERGAGAGVEYAVVQRGLRGVVDAVMAQLGARLSGDWIGDVAAYDEAEAAALELADGMAAMPSQTTY